MQSEKRASEAVLRNPALVIGLGGTGIKVLRFIKLIEKLREGRDEELRRMTEDLELGLYGVDTHAISFDERRVSVRVAIDGPELENTPLGDTVDLPLIKKFSLIDTQAVTRAIKVVNRQIERLGRGEKAASKEFKPEHSAIMDWYPHVKSDGDQSVGLGYDKSSGAGQWRFIGRAGLFLQAKTIFQDLQAMVDRVVAASIERKRPAEVYIVSSLAGGTGSGMFWDIAFMLRMINPDLRIHGCFLMSDAYKNVDKAGRIERNTYAALKELAHYKNWRDGKELRIPYPLGAKHAEFYGEPPEAPIFHLVYLFDGAKPAGDWSDTDIIDLSCRRIAENILSAIRTDIDAVLSVGANNLSGDADYSPEAKESSFVFSTMASVEFPLQSAQEIEAQIRRWVLESEAQASAVGSPSTNASEAELPEFALSQRGGDTLLEKWLDWIGAQKAESLPVIAEQIVRARAGLDALKRFENEDPSRKRADIPAQLRTICRGAFPPELWQQFEEILQAKPQMAKSLLRELGCSYTIEKLLATQIAANTKTLFRACDAIESRLESSTLGSEIDIEALLRIPNLREQQVDGETDESDLVTVAGGATPRHLASLLSTADSWLGVQDDNQFLQLTISNLRGTLTAIIENLERVEIGKTIPISAVNRMHLKNALEDLRVRSEKILESHRAKQEHARHTHRSKKEAIDDLLGPSSGNMVEEQFVEQVFKRFFGDLEDPLQGSTHREMVAQKLAKLSRGHERADSLGADPKVLSIDGWAVSLDAFCADAKERGRMTVASLITLLDHVIEKVDWTKQVAAPELERFDTRLRVAIESLVRFVLGQSEATIEQIGGLDGIRQRLDFCQSRVFELGSTEHGPERTNLLMIPPSGMIGESDGRTGRRVIHDMLEGEARKTFPGNPNVEIGDPSPMPIIFYQALFRAPQEIRNIETLYRAYMSERHDRRVFFHFDRKAVDVPELQVEFRSPEKIRCGNPDCDEDIATLDRTELSCTGCGRRIKTRCGNSACVANDVPERIRQQNLLAGRDPNFVPQNCPACAVEMPNYWWYCTRPEHSMSLISTQCPVCTACLAEFRSGKIQHHEIIHRHDRSGMHCAGCLDLGAAGGHELEIITPELNSFLIDGVPCEQSELFRQHLDEANRRKPDSSVHHDGFLCPSSPPSKMHFLFPTCPHGAENRATRHHLVRTPHGFVCPEHHKLSFYECHHCCYPISTDILEASEDGAVECPRCMRLLRRCGYCSDRDQRLFECDPHADENQRCPRCTNLMLRDPDIPLGSVSVDIKRPAFCTNVFDCAAGNHLWDTTASQNELRHCEVCVDQRSQKPWHLKAHHYAVKHARECPACRFVLGLKESDKTVRPETIGELRESMRNEGLRNHQDANFRNCPVCGCFHEASYQAIGLPILKDSDGLPKADAAEPIYSYGMSEAPTPFIGKPGAARQPNHRAGSAQCNPLEILRVISDERDDSDALMTLRDLDVIGHERTAFRELRDHLLDLFSNAPRMRSALSKRLRSIEMLDKEDHDS